MYLLDNATKKSHTNWLHALKLDCAYLWHEKYEKMVTLPSTSRLKNYSKEEDKILVIDINSAPDKQVILALAYGGLANQMNPVQQHIFSLPKTDQNVKDLFQQLQVGNSNT